MTEEDKIRPIWGIPFSRRLPNEISRLLLIYHVLFVMELSFEDFCLIVAISEATLPKDANIEWELKQILSELTGLEESLCSLCQNVLLSAIYSSQTHDLRAMSKEIARIVLIYALF